MNLFGLIGKLEGFGDPSVLEAKIDDIAQLLGEAGIDYLADVRPGSARRSPSPLPRAMAAVPPASWCWPA